jgi:hypothetical protein
VVVDEDRPAFNTEGGDARYMTLTHVNTNDWCDAGRYGGPHISDDRAFDHVIETTRAGRRDIRRAARSAAIQAT